MKLQILQQGQYGQSRWENVILRLVEALVLFGFARVLTDMVARYVLYGDCYIEAVVHKVDLRVKPISEAGGGGAGKVAPGGVSNDVPAGIFTVPSSEQGQGEPSAASTGGVGSVKGGEQSRAGRASGEHQVLQVDDSGGDMGKAMSPSGESGKALLNQRSP